MANPQRRSPAARRESGPEWALNCETFDGLLRFLDPDRDRAAVRYEDIRRRLAKLFAWRGCQAPDEYFDRTMDRVARRLAEGADIRVTDPYAYIHGVAQNVLREHWRDRGRLCEVLDPDGRNVGHLCAATTDEARGSLDRTLACLEACLERLPPRTRALLIDYHAGPDHIPRRRALAAALGIPMNALRIRVHRIRSSVERCVREREKGSDGGQTGVRHLKFDV